MIENDIRPYKIVDNSNNNSKKLIKPLALKNCGAYNGEVEKNVDDINCVTIETVESINAAEISKCGVMREKLDSGSGLSLTKSTDSLFDVTEPEPDEVFRCVSFNGNASISGRIGTNRDGFTVHEINDMPPNLTLLAASQYASKGAVVLFQEKGVIIKGSKLEIENFRKFVDQQTVFLNLKVVRGTYEVSRDDGLDKKDKEDKKVDITENLFGEEEEEECGGVTYFNGLNGRNTKIQVANENDRIMTLLLCGWSMKDLEAAAKYNTILGMHPTITSEAIREFIKLNGSSLNVVSMALSRNQPNIGAFEGIRKKPERMGHLQMDIGEFDFLDELKEGDKKRRKLASFGGALFFALWVDEYSGFLRGKLLKNTKNVVEVVKYAIQGLRRDGHTAHEFTADTGINSAAVWQVMSPEVERYLLDEGILVKRSEPRNHANGTSQVEAGIGNVKILIRFAYQYMFGNNILSKLKDVKESDILKLWGEIFTWAVIVSGLKRHRSIIGQTI